MNQVMTHPEYIWWNGERRPWEECTIHVTELGWSTVGAVFEGIRAYTGDDDELYIFRLAGASGAAGALDATRAFHARLQPGRADRGHDRSPAGKSTFAKIPTSDPSRTPRRPLASALPSSVKRPRC